MYFDERERAWNRARVGIVAVLAIVSLCGCGSSSPPHVSRGAAAATRARLEMTNDAMSVSRLLATSLPPQYRLLPEAPQLQYQLLPQPPQPSSPPLGAAQQTDAGGAELAVTITKLTDPLLDSGASLLPATRAVGVFVEIANSGPATYDSSATGDFSLVASGGAVTPVFAPHGACQTPLQDFDNYITAGEDRSGCVAFSVATGSRIQEVRFSPHAARAGSLIWRVSP